MENENLEYNFTVIDDNGNEVKCDVLSILQDKQDNSVYVLYTDYTLNDKNQLNTFLSELKEEKGQYTLKTVKGKEKFNYLFENAIALYGKSLKELMNNQ